MCEFYIESCGSYVRHSLLFSRLTASPPGSQVFSYGKMKIKEDSQTYSPLPDLWVSGAVLRVCDTDAITVTSCGHSDVTE